MEGSWRHHLIKFIILYSHSPKSIQTGKLNWHEIGFITPCFFQIFIGVTNLCNCPFYHPRKTIIFVYSWYICMWDRGVPKGYKLACYTIRLLISGSESQYGNSASYHVSILIIHPGTDEITVGWFYGFTLSTVTQT